VSLQGLNEFSVLSIKRRSEIMNEINLEAHKAFDFKPMNIREVALCNAAGNIIDELEQENKRLRAQLAEKQAELKMVYFVVQASIHKIPNDADFALIGVRYNEDAAWELAKQLILLMYGRETKKEKFGYCHPGGRDGDFYAIAVSPIDEAAQIAAFARLWK
jgi:hypothetical protein